MLICTFVAIVSSYWIRSVQTAFLRKQYRLWCHHQASLSDEELTGKVQNNIRLFDSDDSLEIKGSQQVSQGRDLHEKLHTHLNTLHCKFHLFCFVRIPPYHLSRDWFTHKTIRKLHSTTDFSSSLLFHLKQPITHRFVGHRRTFSWVHLTRRSSQADKVWHKVLFDMTLGQLLCEFTVQKDFSIYWIHWQKTQKSKTCDHQELHFFPAKRTQTILLSRVRSSRGSITNWKKNKL